MTVTTNKDEQLNGRSIEECKEESSQDDSLYETLDGHKVLAAFGTFGTYQMTIYTLVNTCFFFFSIIMMIIPFITEPAKFTCDNTFMARPQFRKLDECEWHDTAQNNKSYYCTVVPGSRINFINASHTLAADFQLICDYKNSGEHVSSAFLLGGMLVAPIVMQLADWFGRRSIFLLTLYACLVVNVASTYTYNWRLFLTLRFLAGLFATCYCGVGMTLGLESVDVNFRSYLPILFNFFWEAGYLMAGVLKLYIEDWRTIYLIAALCGAICIPFYWWIPESVHFMVTMKQHKKLKKYVKTAEWINRKKIDLTQCQLSEEDKKAVPIVRSMCDIFSTPPLCLNLIINGCIFLVLNFVYWSLSLFSTDLSEDKMTGFFLSGLIEIPGAILANILIYLLPRKTVSFWSLIIQGICLMFIRFLPVRSYSSITCSLITKCFTVVIWSNHPLHCSESTPTSVRSVFLGILGFLRDFGGVLAPYVKRISDTEERTPAAVMSIMVFMAAIFTLLLPETKDKKLPEDLPDFDPGPALRAFYKMDSKVLEMTPEDTPMISLSPSEAKSLEVTAVDHKQVIQEKPLKTNSQYKNCLIAPPKAKPSRVRRNKNSQNNEIEPLKTKKEENEQPNNQKVIVNDDQR